ncbi:MAG: hypothetical protein EBU08_12305 [Micrococcales bacterium]|nr:hypothetical protein [Micrococcales bacterium]
MKNLIADLESGLEVQLSALADKIRSAETSLITTKEGYLKVQGALEILDVLKKRIQDDDAVALSVAGVE